MNLRHTLVELKKIVYETVDTWDSADYVPLRLDGTEKVLRGDLTLIR